MEKIFIKKRVLQNLLEINNIPVCISSGLFNFQNANSCFFNRTIRSAAVESVSSGAALFNAVPDSRAGVDGAEYRPLSNYLSGAIC